MYFKFDIRFFFYGGGGGRISHSAEFVYFKILQFLSAIDVTILKKSSVIPGV